MMKSRLSLRHTCAIRRSWWVLGLLALGAILLSACTPTPTPPPPPSDCVDFEDPPLGTRHNILDMFTDSGAKIFVGPFQWGNGQWTSDGYAEVGDARLAGGAGQEIQVNNVNLIFDFCSPIQSLSLRFGEYGGNLNIKINDEFVNFEDFSEIDGRNIGWVDVSVINGFGDDTGSLEASGAINSFAVGGQELWIDDVCP